MTGKVYLVGAGPGDPGLITVKGQKLVGAADVLVYDYLANPTLVALCPESCERIYVGKKGGEHTMGQADINALLVSLAQSGKMVVRLKGGDPFVFGRGGEEALELAKNDISFEVVPGITSGVAAPAYAGIPLTHRGLAASALLVTGHEAAGKAESDIDWGAIAQSKTTIAFYMGVKNLESITERLLDCGKEGDTPAALVRWGTLAKQQTITGSLSEISRLADEAGFKAPAICIVGEVAGLRDRLRWFDTRPLFGRRIVVTRSRTTGSSLAEGLREEGGDVIEFPTIRIEKIDSENLASGPAAGEKFDWYIFTSRHSVQYYFEELFASGRDTRSLAGARFGCVGSETASALLSFGLRADVVPERQTSEGLIGKLDELYIDFSGTRVCFPCSEIAKKTIPDGLNARGADVSAIVMYRTVMPQYTREEIAAVFDPAPDIVTFTSSSTVDNLVAVLESSGQSALLETITGAAIGPSTEQTALRHGVKLGCVSAEPNIESLLSSITQYLKETS